MTDLLKQTLSLFEVDNKAKTYKFSVDPIIGSAFLAYKKYTESDNNILIYVKNTSSGQDLYENLSKLIDPDHIIFVPSDELVRVEYISESKELTSELIYSLYKIRKQKHNVIIVTPSILYRYYPNPTVFDDNFIDIKVGDTLSIADLKDKLTKFGYIRVPKIDQSLEFASRGDIIDVFSLNYDNPIRIEFFDDIVESIRMFEISTQESYQKYEKVTIIPATSNLLSKEEKEKIHEKMIEQMNLDLDEKEFENREEFVRKIYEDLDEIENSTLTNQLYKYYGFLQDKHYDFLDYFDEKIDVIYAGKDDFLDAAKSLFTDANLFLYDLQLEEKILSNLSYFNEHAKVVKNDTIKYELDTINNSKSTKIIGISEVFYLKQRNFDLKSKLQAGLDAHKNLIVFARDEGEMRVIEKALIELGYDPKISQNYDYFEDKKVTICVNKNMFSFESNFLDFTVVSTSDLLIQKEIHSAYSARFKKGKILKSYEELNPGDYVVHEKYGIGRFSKIETINLKGVNNDYIEIFYANNDRLYIPLYQFNMVRKYSGREGMVPKLTNLHSNQRERKKERIKERINDLADRLLALYQERAEIEGFAFEKDDEIQIAFEKDFAHELTKDQIRSIQEIKYDMEQPHPMDRLLCGDVGFGKTEVALEAAMKAILSGKQVLLLCPTTVLASQHFRVAKERFSNFKIDIRLLSRMVAPKEAEETIKDVASGKVNLLVGTHKTLSNSIIFRDLGLLIVDEEQRFGVEQKENIRERYKNVDTLTLSATPIPRTLQSGLVGLKQISRIESAPIERLPIQTYVVNYDKNLVRDLIKRELGRKGQVFYIFNNISRIEDKALQIQNLVPEARIGIIHGRMDREDIDLSMEEFYVGEKDILLATTIVENGIDVRNANLLIVEDADHYGLSQLYQIKGRVGRGDKIAYAYLMVDGRKTMNDDAKKRLKAITDFTELGSGYKIAQRDLIIRGAGDILGKEQAGFIDDVGVDMYIKILNETMEERRGIQKPKNLRMFKTLNELNAYVPSDFAENEEKMEIYQDILNVKTFEELDNYRKELKDRYGKLPESIEVLFLKAELMLRLNKEYVKELNDYDTTLDLVLSEEVNDINGFGTMLFTGTVRYMNTIKLMFIDNLIHIRLSKSDEWIEILLNVLKIIDEIYLTKKGNVVYASW